jgi:hypothetical protein
MSTELFLNFLAIKMDSRRAERLAFAMNLVTPDVGAVIVEQEKADTAFSATSQGSGCPAAKAAPATHRRRTGPSSGSVDHARTRGVIPRPPPAQYFDGTYSSGGRISRSYSAL